MKLAEALILRADCQKRLESLRQRIVKSAKVQEGDQPAEDPKALLEEAEQVANELFDLIRRVNRTNSLTLYAEGRTLSDALAERDVLAKRRAIFTDLAQAATVTQDRYSKSEVKFRSTVNVAQVQKQVDEYSREYRELDSRIQELNWSTELAE